VDTTALTDSDAPAPGRTRRNRGSEVVRGALVNAAIGEFASHGFEGSSTRRIAETADAHQSQIKYHFDTKDELWKRCIDLLIGELDEAVSEQFDATSNDARAGFEATFRGMVTFFARRPELSRMMMHEAMSDSERLEWLVDTKLRDRHVALTQAWTELVDQGLVPAIDPDLLYHTVIGASSLIYANAPEARLLGIDASQPELIQRHADALVALFLGPE
jgi:TetR/AcrR family transcriptional regulator